MAINQKMVKLGQVRSVIRETFEYGNKRAAEIAVNTVSNWMDEYPGPMERVIFNVFKDEDKDIYERLLS